MSESPRLRAYRRLLLLFPPSFRDDHGHDMERVFLGMVREWEDERGGLGARFWASLMWDTAVEAGRAWMMTMVNGIRSATAMTMGEHMSALWGDVRFAIRQLVRQPVYAVTIVFLMALGIAGNAAVFRVVNGLFIKPLPFDEPGQLVDLNETAPSWDLEYLQIAYRDFYEWREHNGTFQAMSAISFGGGNLAFEGGAERVSFLQTTHDIDEVLRIQPVIGRFYGPEEDTPDGPRGVLITQGFWAQQFGSDPDVLGTTMSLSGFPVEVIGVLPPEARFVAEVDLWLPLRQDRSNFQGWGLQGIGRLKPDVTIEQAYDDLLAIHKGMIDEFEVNEISSPTIESLRDRFLGGYLLGSGFMMAAVGIVLLIACANIAGLMFVRSLARGPEMSGAPSTTSTGVRKATRSSSSTRRSYART